ncbi:tRNA (guanine-N(7)-)-methyltransferase [Sphaceloma murrayae]|uniref:tRNA (guanine-N(7)-)-methyltransferase n=1 Tax=Sphaceloma murrayae TaxID=2082308 RepID=A0A2K1QXI4_9PEZI|nr:tRNA (guanine-N(7)-)-methyltransferase [Sphaceloma murrayae]
MAGPANKRQKREQFAAQGELPKKKFYRQRAHANPFSDHALTYPATPNHMDWTTHFPAFVDDRKPSDSMETGTEDSHEATLPRPLKQPVEIADIGCGFGGLLFALSPRMPTTLIVGLEIRTSVTAYVQEKVKALRNRSVLPSAPSDDPSAPSAPSSNPTDAAPPPTKNNYNNVSALRANTMKFLPNFFQKGQLRSIFLCFPDPHFKARKHKARIVSQTLNAEYAYVLRPGGCVFTITDVRDLHEWIVGHFEKSEGWERVNVQHWVDAMQGIAKGDGNGEVDGAVEELDVVDGPPSDDEIRMCVRLMMNETEEGKKVTRNKGNKYVAVFRRQEDPPWPE